MTEDNKKSENTVNDAVESVKETTNEFSKGLNDLTGSAENKKMLAGLLAIFLGSFGAHKFILGYQKEGLILLGVFGVSVILMCAFIGALIVWIPGTIGLVEGIIYLTKSDEEFYETYQANKKAWF